MSHYPILCVDLDGTLIYSDVSYLSFRLFLCHQPLSAWRAFFWIMKGKGYLKDKIGQRVRHLFRPARLCYNQEVLRYIHDFKSNNTGKVILTTGSNRHLARLVAEYLNVFDYVLASDQKTNLVACAKLRQIRKHYPTNPMVYMGNSNQDIPLWFDSASAIMVGENAKREKTIRSRGIALTIFNGSVSD